MTDTPAPAWIAIAGPTASGKTALALALARHWPIEVISVDSALVYRGMDIGTAKPSPQELRAVPHHLIDLRDPKHSYSAAEFVRDTHALIPQIQTRGHLPVLVGGTMLYFKALFDGLDQLPAAQPELRAAIEADANALGWPALHARLAEVDAQTAARLWPNDSQRISRALEVWMATGKTLSSFHTRQSASTSGSPHGVHISNQAGLFLSLEPLDRAWLHQRIAERFDSMLQQGFIDEVMALRKQSSLSPNLPSMRCVGYRQAWEALDLAQQQGRYSLNLQELDDFRQRGIAATRQLAKRQLTWLRGMPNRQVLQCDQPEFLSEALKGLLDRLKACD